MKFYTEHHRFYCGIDLHASWMYVCILDAMGKILVHRNIPTDPEVFRKLIAPYREGLVVAVECIFTWYWLADFCSAEGIPFVLGHALYMRAIHGAKAKNDKIDSAKIARLLRGGDFPLAYVYPAGMREVRDLLRRRDYLVRHRAECLAHVRNTAHQGNLPALPAQIRHARNRTDIEERFPAGPVRSSVAMDLRVVDAFTPLIKDLETQVLASAKAHDAQAMAVLRSINGVGDILALTFLYEIHDIRRFPTVQDFLSYCRLVKCSHESNGKRSGTHGAKIGNVHLKWAFSEAAMTFVRHNPEAERMRQRLQKRFGKGKALSILARKLGSAVYFMLKRKEPFSAERFYAESRPRPDGSGLGRACAAVPKALPMAG